MTARKREFFEAFQNENLGKRTTPPASQGKRPARPAAPQKSQPRRDSSARGYSISQDKMIGGMVAIVALLIVSFVFGFMVGRRGDAERVVMLDDEDVALLSDPTDAVDIEDEGETVDSSELPSVFYKLQIVGGINANSAEQLANFLQDQGYRPSATRQGNRYTVYVGEFDSPNSPEAQAFKERFTDMEYQGRQQFSDCLYIRFERED